jgi:hypothetical protein
VLVFGRDLTRAKQVGTGVRQDLGGVVSEKIKAGDLDQLVADSGVSLVALDSPVFSTSARSS